MKKLSSSMPSIDKRISIHLGLNAKQVSDLFSIWLRINTIMTSGNAEAEAGRIELMQGGYNAHKHVQFELLVKGRELIPREEFKEILEIFRTFYEARVRNYNDLLSGENRDQAYFKRKVTPLKPGGKIENGDMKRIFHQSSRAVANYHQAIKENALHLRQVENVMRFRDECQIIPFRVPDIEHRI